MAGIPQTKEWNQPSRRRGARYGVQVPLDVTVLRSGIPDTLPGRSVDMGDGGLAAVVAGELTPGEAVGVEIRLGAASDPLRTRALIRHHNKLRAGMEFVGLSREQQTAIRNWSEAATVQVDAANPEKAIQQGDSVSERGGAESGGPGSAKLPPESGGRSGLLFLLLFTAILLGALWWGWNRSWEELEAGLPEREATQAQRPQAQVPGNVMEARLKHRVDPDYPAAARPAKLQGVIVLEVVVGRDGSVLDVHAKNGPEILAKAAVDALRWWRFEPYRVDGQPVVVETTMAVEFKP